MSRRNLLFLNSLAIASIALFGCQSQQPVFDPFTPYGAQRIPPPPTGSIGSNNGYYQPTASASLQPAAVAQLQPIPSLSSQPAAAAPPQPSTLAPPPLSNGENWESAKAPGPDFGAATTPSPKPADQSLRSSIPRDVRPADNLAWQSPFGQRGSVIAPTYQPAIYQDMVSATQPYLANPTYPVVPAPNYIQPAAAQVPIQPQFASPVRPAAVRSFSPNVGSEANCNCDRAPQVIGMLQPTPLSTAEGSSSSFDPTGRLQWR